MIQYCRYCGKKLVVNDRLDVLCPKWDHFWSGVEDKRHDHWWSWQSGRPSIENVYDRETGKKLGMSDNKDWADMDRTIQQELDKTLHEQPIRPNPHATTSGSVRLEWLFFIGFAIVLLVTVVLGLTGKI